MLFAIRLSLSVPLQLLRAAGQILKSPKLFALAAVPAAIGSATFVLGIILTTVFRADITAQLGINPESWWFALTGWLVVLLSIFLAALLGFVSANLIGMFSIDALVDKFLVLYGVRDGSEVNTGGLLALIKSTISELGFISLITFITIFTLVSSFVPILAALSAGLGVFLIGTSFFSTALALTNIGFKQKVSIIWKLTLPSFSLGGLFTLLLFIPFVGLVLMPVFSGAAAIILARSGLVTPTVHRPEL